MSSSLRDQLIGAWELVSYVERPIDGGPERHPLGEQVRGLIIYTPDGYMSAQLMAPDRPAFASGDWFDASDEELRAEATGYIAYSGPFHVDEQGRLFHTMQVSLFPNWLGQTQQRIVDLQGDTLHLSAAAPIRSGGVQVSAYLTWRRAGSLQ